MELNELDELSPEEMNLLTSTLKSIPKETLDKLLTPPSKALGEGIGKTIDLLFYPVNYLHIHANAKLTSLHEKTSKKLEKVKEENNYTEEKIGMAAKAIEDAKYQLDSETLQEFFSELISNSLNKQKVSEISPKFSSVLSNLTEEEALFLRKSKEYLATSGSPNIIITLDLNFINSVTTERYTHSKNYVLWSQQPFEYEYSDFVITSLVSAGIFTVETYKKEISLVGIEQDVPNIIDTIIHEEKYFNYQEDFDTLNTYPDKNFDAISPYFGFIELTEFGKKFLDTVVV